MICTHNAGLTSCLSVRLAEAMTYRREHGHWPEEIDSSKQFEYYYDSSRNPIDHLLLAPYHPWPEAPDHQYGHDWQWKWYDEIGLWDLAHIALSVCPPSDLVRNRAAEMSGRIQGRTAVLYRGNDKIKEIARTPYEQMFLMARDTGAGKFVVQTDEAEFLDAFKDQFPDTVTLGLPMISRNDDQYVMPPPPLRPTFAVDFNAALIAIAQCQRLILNTGNTAIWTMLYRGSTKNTWQYHPHHLQWRKLKS